MKTTPSQRQKKVGPMKGQKYDKPRENTCSWTPELDEVLKTAWEWGGLRAARRAIRQQQPTWSWWSIKKRAAALSLGHPKSRPVVDGQLEPPPYVHRQQRFARADCGTPWPDRDGDPEKTVGPRLQG